ncbi:MAG: hypothetical protein LGB53_00975 [Sulfurovum sp.]|nr:hypothetical protein [Sulfurovum sp.]
MLFSTKYIVCTFILLFTLFLPLYGGNESRSSFSNTRSSHLLSNSSRKPEKWHVDAKYTLPDSIEPGMQVDIDVELFPHMRYNFGEGSMMAKVRLLDNEPLSFVETFQPKQQFTLKPQSSSTQYKLHFSIIIDASSSKNAIYYVVIDLSLDIKDHVEPKGFSVDTYITIPIHIGDMEKVYPSSPGIRDSHGNLLDANPPIVGFVDANGNPL